MQKRPEVTERPGKADLHVHTSFSDGVMDVPELLDYVEGETDLDVVAVTDHDDIRGSWDAREQWAKGSYRYDLVTGIEVTALEGHVLALFVEEPVPSLRPVEEVLEAVHRQGGLCLIPHPMSWLTRSIGRRTMRRVAAAGNDGVYFDGIETANQSPAARIGLRKAMVLNRSEFGLAEVGGSDAHFLPVIGTAYTTFAGRTGDDLRRSIVERQTQGTMGVAASLRRIGVRKMAWQTWRGISATPRAMGWGPTAYSFVRRMFGPR